LKHRETPVKRINPSGRTVWVARYTGPNGRRVSAGTFKRKGPCLEKNLADCCAQHAIDAAYQRHMALMVANERRTAIADQRRLIASLPQQDGLELVSDLLAYPTAAVAAMPVGRLLLAVRKVGVSTVGTWLSIASVRSADRRVDQLTERQRMALSSAVRKGRMR
jgi:hypothetical protein